MNSEEKNALFFDALVGELSAERRAQLDALLQDPRARAEFDELRSLWSDLGDVLTPRASADTSPLGAIVRQLPQRAAAPRRGWWVGAIAAGVMLFFLGAWLGTTQRVAETSGERLAESTDKRDTATGERSTTTGERGTPTDERVGATALPRFVILLYGRPSSAPPDPARLRQAVDELKSWRDQLDAERRHVLAEKLSAQPSVELESVDGAVEQRNESTETGTLRLGGLYIVHAKDLDEAAAIARQCPLLRYGGVVRVRAVDDV